MNRLNAIAALCLMTCASFVWAQDRAKTDSPTAGNQELPKVLYIVPWKKSVQGDVSGRPSVSVINEELMPLDRDVFRRQMQTLSKQNPSDPVKDAGGKP